MISVSACTTPLPNLSPDGGTDANDPDASEATQLVFEFAAAPEIPLVAEGPFNVQLDGVHLELENARALGDAGVTTPSLLSLDWNDVLIPPPYIIRGAAPGLYSQLRATVLSYELYGTVLVGGTRVPFEILDSPPSFTLEMELVNCVVQAGEAKLTPIVFDSEEIIEAIVWGDVVPDSDGVLRIDANDPELIALVRSRLEESFEYDPED